MKKLLVYSLVAIMGISGLAACGNNKNTNEDALQEALDYVDALYRKASVETPQDFTRTAQVMIENVKYEVEWTADTDEVKVTVDGTTATIDVNEETKEEIQYVLTATVKDADGNKLSKEYKHTIPKNEGQEGIVKQAYKLEDGATMEGTFTLTGVITNIKDAYSAQYGNITVDIQIGELKDMPIRCYRLAGDGADAIKLGDTITVSGSLTNYSGIIEFAQGCTLDKVVAGEGTTDDEPSNDEPGNGGAVTGSTSEILDAAYALEEGGELSGDVTLVGVIKEIGDLTSYGDRNATIVCGGDEERPMYCYGLKGDCVEGLKVGDTIKVVGKVKNYKGTIEFHLPQCTLEEAGDGSASTTPSTPSLPTYDPDDTKSILDAAYALTGSQTLEELTLTGVVTEMSELNEQYGDRNVTIVCGGYDDMPIYCYALKGDIIADLEVGDKITVTGTMKNYNGTIEFDKAQAVEAE